MTFHSYTLITKGEEFKGLSKFFVFGDSCQRGESIRPKAKGPHHHIFKIQNFNWYFIWFKIFNWYNFIWYLLQNLLDNLKEGIISIGIYFKDPLDS
jgi:hypothetical protein